MSEPWQLGAVELAARIRARELSSREVLEAHLTRLEVVNPHLNAVVRVLADEAREAADAADRLVASGAELGPLHGVPITVKENIDLAGTPTTHGVPALADAVADTDAPVVTRMRAAGAIPFARTNLPDLALRIHTHSTLHGLTRNPWSPAATAGGSSGGEGAAIASGISPLGLGNDIGGSLRNPAHCCGIASCKPSTGVVPFATVIPPVDPGLASQLMSVEGVMARTVADVRAGLLAVAGPDPRDPVSLPVVLADDAPSQRPAVAVLLDPPGGTIEPAVRDAVRRAADALADAGHPVAEATPPDYEEVLELWGTLLFADLALQRPLLDAVMGEGGLAVLAGFEAFVGPVDAARAAGVHVRRHALRRAWSAFFAEHPVLLSSVWTRPAFDHDADIAGSADGDMFDTFRTVLPANFLGLPAAVVPAGLATPAGHGATDATALPVGVQVMADRFADLRCLTVAARIEAELGTLTPIDPVTA
jgi:amidase